MPVRAARLVQVLQDFLYIVVVELTNVHVVLCGVVNLKKTVSVTVKTGNRARGMGCFIKHIQYVILSKWLRRVTSD